MATSRLSARNLVNVRKFIERDCNWFRIRKGEHHREFKAVTSSSPYLGRVSEEDDGSCLVAILLIFKRNDGYVMCMSVNGKHLGPFMCAAVRRLKYNVECVGKVYVIHLLSPLMPATLAFSPVLSSFKELAGASGLSPSVIYNNSIVVKPEDAGRIEMHGNNEVTFGVGGAGAWVNVKDKIVTLYVYALCHDLFMACCDRIAFPSLAKIFTESTRCAKDSCMFCSDSGKHVNCLAEYGGCVPDNGLCFCYTACNGCDATVTQTAYMPYLEANDAIYSMFIRRHDAPGIPGTISACIGARNQQGGEVCMRTEPWCLFKVDCALSRLIVLSCPTLKRLVTDYL
ncbi:B94 [Murid betaherpesvirus 8]|uniref:B94 n=2 Tax=Rat cytomegalovirus (isolate England) TaxID=1261657 RepID=K7XWD7_RCMVE|nr:E94 [Murid betaherpesvirus 8]AKE44262.1 a94 [Rat cytomegalovirus ALL-03]AFX83408.1 E94 [Murid betaherpesvirus 8]AKB93288.1 B94 [Murid betaherpesvirus 8]WPH25003.1 B94 [Murid betaherpesvirus 8]WPH25137.1 B94 [Murid betaherpesvirus 8]